MGWITRVTLSPKEVKGYHFRKGGDKVKFSMTKENLDNGIGWFQWGATTDVLGETVDLTEGEVKRWREQYGY